MQHVMFTEVCIRCRWLRVQALRKISLINAPRVSIVINGDEEEEKQFKSGHYSVSTQLIVRPSICIPGWMSSHFYLRKFLPFKKNVHPCSFEN